MPKFKAHIFCFLIFAGAVFNAHSEYNPPVLGEDLFFLAYPSLVSSARSSAGGGVFVANPASVNLNPALVAGMQRTSMDLSYINLGAPAGTDGNAGAVHASLLGSTRWGVWSAAVQGVFAGHDAFTGSTLAMRGGFAKDVTENLYVGADFFAALGYTGSGAAPGIGGDLGIVYNLGDRGGLKQNRIALVVQNIGLTIDAASLKLTGMADGKKTASSFPSAVTPKAGFAAQFVEASNFDAGFSVDVSFAGLTTGGFNPVLDAGVQLRYRRVTLSAAVNVNLAEEIAGHRSLVPAIGLSYSQSVKTGGIDFLSNQGWQQTDITVEGAFHPLADSAILAGGGITANFGARDDTPPAITLWPEEGGGK